MKQADVFMDFVYDSKFCFSHLYYYTVAFDREAEDCDREKHAPYRACSGSGVYRKVSRFRSSVKDYSLLLKSRE